jgi:hypothetical protein
LPSWGDDEANGQTVLGDGAVPRGKRQVDEAIWFWTERDSRSRKYLLRFRSEAAWQGQQPMSSGGGLASMEIIPGKGGQPPRLFMSTRQQRGRHPDPTDKVGAFERSGDFVEEGLLAVRMGIGGQAAHKDVSATVAYGGGRYCDG